MVAETDSGGSNAAKAVDMQFRELIQQGLNLQAVFESEQAIKPKHIAIIQNWMNQTLELIEPVMPPDDAGFDHIKRIGKTYSKATLVLPGDTLNDIRKIYVALITAYDYFCAWCRRDFSEIEPSMRARACHDILVETWRFTRSSLLKSLLRKEDGRTKRTALLHSYGRMYCWIHSMVRLGNENDDEIPVAEYALTLAACLRATFEIFLDINLLEHDKIMKGVEKFFSFEKVARHKIAKKSLSLHERYKHLDKMQCTTMSAYGDKIKGEIDAEIVRLWGAIRNGRNKGKPSRVEHWTGMTVIDRVESLGGDCIRFYQHSYHYCNWSLHSGYIEFLMATEENASLFCALIYTFANEMFLLATEIMIKECAECLDVKTLQERLQKVRLRGAQILWNTVVKVGKGQDEQ